MSFTGNILWLMVTVIPVQFLFLFCESSFFPQKCQITGDACCIFHISGTKALFRGHSEGTTASQGNYTSILLCTTSSFWLLNPLMECYQFKADKLTVVSETRGWAMSLYFVDTSLHVPNWLFHWKYLCLAVKVCVIIDVFLHWISPPVHLIWAQVPSSVLASSAGELFYV